MVPNRATHHSGPIMKPLFHRNISGFSARIYDENSINAACYTFNKLQSKTLTPNKFKNKTNNNLNLLGNNRNHLQRFVKKKIVPVHCCGFLS